MRLVEVLEWVHVGRGRRGNGWLDCGKWDVRVGFEASGAVSEEKW